MRTQDGIPNIWLNGALEDFDIIVLPSITVKYYETRNLSSVHDERALGLLKLLDNKNSRIIYLVSGPIDAEIVKYRLRLCAHGDPDIEKRVIVIPTSEHGHKRSLTEIILDDEELIRNIRSHIRVREKSVLIPHIYTELDEKLRNRLDVPLWTASAPSKWGTKSGSRQAFVASGVPVAEGLMNPVYSYEELITRTTELIKKVKSDVIVKVDDGSGGHGITILRIPSFEDITEAKVKDILEDALTVNTKIDRASEIQEFKNQIEECGVIVEQMINPRSGYQQTMPSVQVFIHDTDKVQVLSSHEQEVDGCTYVGCRYPAEQTYVHRITKYAQDTAATLSRNGVRGFLGIDFLATQFEERVWNIIALEINLRLCATTFPYLALWTLTGCKTKLAQKHYLTMDEAPLLKTATLSQLLEDASASGDFCYNQEKGTGIVFLTLSAVPRGKLGFMCIGNSKLEVDQLLNKFSTKHLHKVHCVPENCQP